MENIILGDCLEKMKYIKNESVDLIVTDPPYLINYRTGYRIDKSHEFCTPILGDSDPELISNHIKECNRIMKYNTAMYMFSSSKKIDFFKNELEKYFKLKNIIIWVKNNWTAGDLFNSFGNQYEVLFLVNKGDVEIKGKRYSDVWNFDRISGDDQLHQNQKPVELIERCILSHSTENDLIFDGFAGSGTTAIACINTNRNYICIEKDPKYYELMKVRIENHIKYSHIQQKLIF